MSSRLKGAVFVRARDSWPGDLSLDCFGFGFEKRKRKTFGVWF